MTEITATTGLLFTLAFALLAYRLRAVDVSGAVAGAAVALTLYWSAGPGAFAALMLVFLLTWMATRLGHARKQQLGKAERRGGRTAAQVGANLGAAAGCALATTIWRDNPALVLAMAAALAEAAADTVSSECGVAWSDRVHLITTWRRIPPGTDGGVSLPGTLAGISAALLVVSACAAFALIAPAAVPMAAAAAVLGMFFDSLLGATLERRRFLGNNTVNLSGTTFAAAATFLVARLI